MAKEQEVASAERLAAEGGIASDESAVKKLEIEANKGPAEKHENELNESAAAESDDGKAGCPFRMGYYGVSGLYNPRCRRNLHAATDGVDEMPVCLMHSRDPNKQSGPLFDAFWLEFERILKGAGEGEAHFERFVFPQLNSRGKIFQAICWFDGATFTQDADFGEATFTQDVHFLGATFTKDADFWRTTFMRKADFGSATFKRDANFSYATFTRDADFGNAIFTMNTKYDDATFMQDASFVHATFMQYADFHITTFKQNAVFNYATFTLSAGFSGATFTKAIRYLGTAFRGTAYWRGCQFLDQADFLNTQFNPSVEGEPSAVFALAKFSKPDEIVFDQIDLSRVFFHKCDVSQVWFTSSVRWGTRGKNRGLTVFEETIPLKQELAWQLQRNGLRDYRAVEQIYHQLKKNYDSRLDYWTANEFHFGEMEMKRQAGPADGWFLSLRRWLYRKLSLVALYRWASDYGNNYVKPMAWLLGTLLAAALLFPITGLELKQATSASSARVTYGSVWDRENGWTNNFWTEAKLIGKSGITAIDTATFQRTPEYTPVYPRGRVVAIFETLLTSSLFALFLLAIRRQFRR
jgi:uncharacterized protein YjbI with pentapeptide repeats